MLFASGVFSTPDFWMGMVCGIFGTVIVGTIALKSLAKSATTSSADNTYWWNGGKKPDFDKDYED
jgi:hypothetical protein